MLCITKPSLDCILISQISRTRKKQNLQYPCPKAGDKHTKNTDSSIGSSRGYNSTMFNRGRHFDSGDPREMQLKRQRIMDEGFSYFSVQPEGSSHVYNPPGYPYNARQPPPFPNPPGYPYNACQPPPFPNPPGYPYNARQPPPFPNSPGYPPPFPNPSGYPYNACQPPPFPSPPGYPYNARQPPPFPNSPGYPPPFPNPSGYPYNACQPPPFPNPPGYPYNACQPPPFPNPSGPPPFPVVRLRGLPFGCTEGEVADFLHGLNVVDVLLVHKRGKLTGEAYCVLGHPLQVDLALQRNMQNMGKRYIEVFRSEKKGYYRAIANELSMASSSGPSEGTSVLRMRGLPHSVTNQDIKAFFKEFVLSDESIHIERRPTGDGFVQFASPGDAKAAMAKDMMTLGRGYIELFPSSIQELNEAVSRVK